MRIEALNPTTHFGAEEKMAHAWENLARFPPSQDVYEKALVESWREAGCHLTEPYVLRAMLVRLMPVLPPPGGVTVDNRIPTSVLAAALLDEEHCPGGLGLSEEERAKLREIRDGAPLEPQNSAAVMSK